jgi:hypothetical protein
VEALTKLAKGDQSDSAVSLASHSGDTSDATTSTASMSPMISPDSTTQAVPSSTQQPVSVTAAAEALLLQKFGLGPLASVAPHQESNQVFFPNPLMQHSVFPNLLTAGFSGMTSLSFPGVGVVATPATNSENAEKIRSPSFDDTSAMNNSGDGSDSANKANNAALVRGKYRCSKCGQIKVNKIFISSEFCLNWCYCLIGWSCVHSKR